MIQLYTDKIISESDGDSILTSIYDPIDYTDLLTQLIPQFNTAQLLDAIEKYAELSTISEWLNNKLNEKE